MRSFAFLLALIYGTAIAGPICGNGGPITSGGGEGLQVGNGIPRVMTCQQADSNGPAYWVDLKYVGQLQGVYRYQMNLSYLNPATNCETTLHYEIANPLMVAPSNPANLTFSEGSLDVPYWNRTSGQNLWQGEGILNWQNTQISLNCTLYPFIDSNCRTGCGGDIESCQCDH